MFVKGKKRLGFDLEIKIKWRGITCCIPASLWPDLRAGQAQGKSINGSGVLTLESDTGGGVFFAEPCRLCG